MVVEPVKPVPVPAKPKPIPPVVQEKKDPVQPAVVVSKPDSLPPAVVDSPRKALPEPARFSIPLAGTVSMAQADSVSQTKTDTTVRVMPGPGFVQDSSPAYSRITLDEPDLPLEHELTGCTFVDGRRSLLNASAALQLGKGGWEFKWYNQLYTQKAYFNEQGVALDQSKRSSYFSSILNVVYGLGPRVNIGVDAWVQSVALTPHLSSPFSFFSFPGGNDARTALTALGPKIRISPSRKWHGLIQSSFLIPMAKDPEGRSNGKPYLATENYIWWTQAYQNFSLGRNLQLYGELNAYWNINRGLGNGHLDLPASAILSWLPSNKASFMAMVQFWPGLGGRLFSFWWAQAGLGCKFALNRSLMAEMMYGRFVAGMNSAGPANSFNVGLRYVIW